MTAGIETSGPFSELYNPATGQWSSAGGPTACTAAMDCLLGTDSNPSSSGGAVLYNPAANTWTATGAMNTAREDETTNLLPDGQVLAAGGVNFVSHKFTELASAELYTP